MNGRLTLVLIIAAGILFFNPTLSFAATILDGVDITEDTTWTKDEGPYVITGGYLIVREGITLTLEPGTIVKFEKQDLAVYGTLDAQGTAENPITFTSIRDDSIGGDTNGDGDVTEPAPFENWTLWFHPPSEGSVIKHAYLKYGRGLGFYGAAPKVEHVYVSDSEYGIWASNGAKAEIEHFHAQNIESFGINASFGVDLTVRSSVIENVLDINAVNLYRSNLTMENSELRNSNGGDMVNAYQSNLLFEKSILHNENSCSRCSGVVVSGSNVVVKQTLVESFESGLESYRSRLTVSSSTIRNNEDGIISIESEATIHGTSISDNTNAGLINDEGPAVDARHNWWGDPSGPLHLTENPEGLGDRILGDVAFEPWLLHEPATEEEPELPECCSSVVFLPGFQASRLYQKGTLFENQLWEPNRNEDARALLMNENGESVESGIYTRDIIGETNILTPDGFGGLNIYKEFSQKMDDLVSEETIAEWRAFPYDWRYDLPDIISGGVKTDSGAYHVLEEITAIAERSDTGKVTIIGHSNGGLVGKLLIAELEQQGTADLIDSLIMVGTPQLGTPAAIAAFLHGHEQEQGLGWLISKETARVLAENMPGAYNLLPYGAYFDRITDPVVLFDPHTEEVESWRSAYGHSIDSVEELHAFLLGKEGRTKPAVDTITTPNILNSELLGSATALRDPLDNWEAPDGVEVYQVVGWGLDTLKGINYTEKTECGPALCTTEFDYEPLFTIEGDKTVVWPSAGALATSTFYFHLRQHNSELLFGARRNREHADILESEPIRELITQIVADNLDSLPRHVQTDKYEPENENERLRISIHSPVAISAADSLGNYTGLVESPGTDSDLQFIAEQIPNSYYMEFGEGKYLGLDTEDVHTITLEGTGSGTFTLVIRKINGDRETGSLVYSDVPVKETTVASIVIQSSDTVGGLLVDYNGDGETDFIVSDDTEVTAAELIQQFIAALSFTDVSIPVYNKLSAQAGNVDRFVAKDQTDPARSNLESMKKTIEQYAGNGIAEDDALVLLNIFTKLQNKL